MVQMFCRSLKASTLACLTAANALNYVGGKHSLSDRVPPAHRDTHGWRLSLGSGEGGGGGGALKPIHTIKY